jgi:hypothetical protein
LAGRKSKSFGFYNPFIPSGFLVLRSLGLRNTNLSCTSFNPVNPDSDNCSILGKILWPVGGGGKTMPPLQGWMGGREILFSYNHATPSGFLIYGIFAIWWERKA